MIFEIFVVVGLLTFFAVMFVIGAGGEVEYEDSEVEKENE